MNIAEFNIGVLKYDWDDPRIADFAENLDRLYAIAERSPGYIWHLPSEDMELAQNDPSGALGGNPRVASTLSVWASVDALRAFTFETVHKQFYDRRLEWYDPAAQTGPRLVMWWVAADHRPTVDDAYKRLQKLALDGDGPDAFGWSCLQKTPH